MPDGPAETNRLLGEILAAIKRIDNSLQVHEQHFKDLEAIQVSRKQITTESDGLGTPLSSTELPSVGAESLSYMKTGQNKALYQSILPYPQTANFQEYYLQGLKKSSPDRTFWTKWIGDAWTLPPDNRVELGFEERSLEAMSDYDLTLRLQQLQTFNNNLLETQTPIPSGVPKRRNWFRHFTVEDRIPQRPFEAQSYTIGQIECKSSPTSSGRKLAESTAKKVSIEVSPEQYYWNTERRAPGEAPWQRLM